MEAKFFGVRSRRDCPVAAALARSGAASAGRTPARDPTPTTTIGQTTRVNAARSVLVGYMVSGTPRRRATPERDLFRLLSRNAVGRQRFPPEIGGASCCLR